MKISETYKRMLLETKKIKYDMRNINGGFSGGVDIVPGEHAGVMDITINIYGGSKSRAHPYKVPPSIQQYQQAYLVAKQTGDPVSKAIRQSLRAYYDNLNTSISLEIVRLMREFDAGSNAAINKAVQTVNAMYMQGATQPLTQEPEVAPEQQPQQQQQQQQRQPPQPERSPQPPRGTR